MPIRIMPGEVTPTLFVGLGGSGGRAVGRIAKRLRALDDFDLQYRNLVRFIAIDTNDANLARLRKGTHEYGKVDETCLISDFDKVAYSKLRRGRELRRRGHYFTQWIHDWYNFREESGAGAGQIRIESRLSMFRAIEVGGHRPKAAGGRPMLRSHADGMRHQSASIQVFVYFSVAGGTGSGGFLPFAYMMRDIIADRSARLVGFAILPEAFESVVGHEPRWRLRQQLRGAQGGRAADEARHPVPRRRAAFHYDPRNKHKRHGLAAALRHALPRRSAPDLQPRTTSARRWPTRPTCRSSRRSSATSRPTTTTTPRRTGGCSPTRCGIARRATRRSSGPSARRS